MDATGEEEVEASWVEAVRGECESEKQWLHRRQFLLRNAESGLTSPGICRDRLLAYSMVWANHVFMGCRYPPKVMEKVLEMAKGIKVVDAPTHTLRDDLVSKVKKRGISNSNEEDQEPCKKKMSTECRSAKTISGAVKDEKGTVSGFTRELMEKSKVKESDACQLSPNSNMSTLISGYEETCLKTARTSCPNTENYERSQNSDKAPTLLILHSTAMTSPPTEIVETSLPLIESAGTALPNIEQTATSLPLSESAATALPLIEPKATALPLVELVAKTLPLIEPVATALPLVEHVATALPLVEPAATALPLVEPSVTALHLVEPAATALPLVDPAATALPLMEPVATALPLVEPESTAELIDLVTSALPLNEPAALALPLIETPSTALPLIETPSTALPLIVTPSTALPLIETPAMALPLMETAATALPLNETAATALPPIVTAPKALPLIEAKTMLLPQTESAAVLLARNESTAVFLPRDNSAASPLLPSGSAPLPQSGSMAAPLPRSESTTAALNLIQSVTRTLPKSEPTVTALPRIESTSSYRPAAQYSGSKLNAVAHESNHSSNSPHESSSKSTTPNTVNSVKVPRKLTAEDTKQKQTFFNKLYKSVAWKLVSVGGFSPSVNHVEILRTAIESLKSTLDVDFVPLKELADLPQNKGSQENILCELRCKSVYLGTGCGKSKENAKAVAGREALKVFLKKKVVVTICKRKYCGREIEDLVLLDEVSRPISLPPALRIPQDLL